MTKKSDSKLGDEATFHEALGKALTQWQLVEEELGSVFCASITGAVNHMPTRSAYSTVINFSARLKMVDAAVITALQSSELLNEWLPLQKAVGKKSGIRNKLAHFQPYRVNPRTDAESIVLMPSMFDTDKWHDAVAGKGIKWTYRQIEEFGNSFIHLGTQLMFFAQKIETEHRKLFG